MADSVTVLRDVKPGAASTKRWTRTPDGKWQKNSYGKGSRFLVETRPVANIGDLARLIESIRRDRAAFIIRGQLHDGVDPTVSTVRQCVQKKNGPPPPFVDVPRKWLLADIDGWQIPDGLDLEDDAETIIERAISELLPAPFHDVRAFWQLSSSAGFVPGVLKVHVWFWLDRSIGSALLKQWMKLHAPGVDDSLFSTVQIHYTADPIIEGGPDPIQRRTGWIKGINDLVALPPIDAAEMGRKQWQQHSSAATAAGLSASHASTVDGALALLGDGDGLAGFHDPLRRTAWLYAVNTAPWERNAAALKARMCQAINAAPYDTNKRPGGVAEYLADEYLSRLIDGAFAKNPNGGTWERCAPEHPMPTGSATEARERMRATIRSFLEDPYIKPPPIAAALNPDAGQTPRQGLVVAEVGLGKSRAALEEIAVFIERERGAGRPHRVLYTIPEHRLGTEIVQRARSAGISAMAFYGRDYVPPDGGVDAMCLDTKAAKLAKDAGASVAKTVCGSPGNPNGVCSFYSACRYQQQLAQAATVDMIVLAQNLLFSSLPKQISDGLALVIVDESFWQVGLDTTSITLETLGRGEDEHPVLRTHKSPTGSVTQQTDRPATEELHFMRRRLVEALLMQVEAEGGGYLKLAHTMAVKLTAAECSTAIELEWSRKKFVAMYPGMPHDERRKASVDAATNAQLPRITALWHAVRAMIEDGTPVTGRIEMAQQERASGSQLVALLNIRRDMTAPIRECPVLLLDGTADIDVVREFLPGVEVIAEERPAATHMTVHQVIGPLSKTSLLNRPETVAELRDFIRIKTRGEPTLVVTHQQIEGDFADLPNVQVAHFGAIAGRDEWRDVRHLFVIGRPQPDPDDARAMAARLTGQPVARTDPARATRGVLMVDGSGVGVEVSRFDDAATETIRKAVTDAALIQAVGRARGINRTAETPLDVWIMGNVIAPWPVTDIAKWQDVAPGPIERMAARGMVLLSAADARAVYPDLFVSAKAAEHCFARARGISPPNPYVEVHIREWGGNRLIPVSYRPQGRGQQTRQALVPAATRPDRLVELLAERLKNPVAIITPAPQQQERPMPEATVSAPVGLTFCDAPQELLDPAIVARTPPPGAPSFEPPADLCRVDREVMEVGPFTIDRGPVYVEPPDTPAYLRRPAPDIPKRWFEQMRASLGANHWAATGD